MKRWSEIEDLFSRAMDLPPAERGAFVDASSGDDTWLGDEVRRWIASADDARRRLEQTVGDAARSLQAEVTDERIGQQVGAWRIRRLIGEGGMGTVYFAERADGEFAHGVAVKILQPAFATPRVIGRFRDERQILAAVEHPSIVRLLDGGTSDGLPYLVMEYIDGVSLGSYARERPLRARVELFARVCEPVEFAHQRHVVHRDLKPSNILVTLDGTPKLLDFGIAKLLAAPAEEVRRTRTGLALCTPEYASPEQARGERVSTATDVYSLGAILYELVAGHPPHATSADPLATLRAICEVDPAPPSSRIDARGLADLDSIALKALQKDPALRYRSVRELADDVQRYLRGLPVRAREATLRYRARKLIARHRIALSLATVIAAALVTTTMLSVFQARRAERLMAEQRAQQHEVLVDAAIRELADGRPGRALPFVVEAMRAVDDPSVRFLAGEAMRAYAPVIAVNRELDRGVADLAWSPDGTRYVVMGFGQGRLYDREGRLLAPVEVPASVAVTRVVFTRDEIIGAGTDGIVRVWSGEGALRRTYPIHDGAIVDLSLAGARVVTCGLDGVARVTDPSDGHAIAVVRTARLQACRIAGDRLFTGAFDGEVVAWDASTGEQRGVLAELDGPVHALRVSSDGTRLAIAAGRSGSIWDVTTQRRIAVLDRAPLHWLELSPDGARLAAIGDGAVTIWDARTGAYVRELATRDPSIAVIAFDPSGERLSVGGAANRVQTFHLASGVRELELELSARAGSAPSSSANSSEVAVSPDGTRIVFAVGSETTLLRTGNSQLVREIRLPGVAHALALSPDRERIHVAGEGLLGEWSLRDGSGRMSDPATKLWAIDESRDGALAIAGEGGRVRLVARDGSTRDLGAHAGTVSCARFDPAGRTLATCGEDGRVQLWNLAGGSSVLAHEGRVTAAAWTSSGEQLATAAWDGSVRLWNVRDRVARAVVTGGHAQLVSIAFTPDETGIVTGAHDGEVAIWELSTGRRVRALLGHTASVTSIAFDETGVLATTSWDGTSRIWDPERGRQLAVRVHGAGVMAGAWTSAGFVTVDVGSWLRVWRFDRASGSIDDVDRRARDLTPWRLVEGRLELR